MHQVGTKHVNSHYIHVIVKVHVKKGSPLWPRESTKTECEVNYQLVEVMLPK